MCAKKIDGDVTGIRKVAQVSAEEQADAAAKARQARLDLIKAKVAKAAGQKVKSAPELPSKSAGKKVTPTLHKVVKSKGGKKVETVEKTAPKGKVTTKATSTQTKPLSITKALYALFDEKGEGNVTVAESTALALSIKPDSKFNKWHLYFHRRNYRLAKNADLAGK